MRRLATVVVVVVFLMLLFSTGALLLFQQVLPVDVHSPDRPLQLQNTRLCFRELEHYEFKLQMLYPPQMLPKPVVWVCSISSATSGNVPI